MTRRAQVVRSSRGNGPSAQRAFPGGATIFCALDSCGRSSGDRTLLASLPVTAQDPFQRFFVSATLNDVRSWWPSTGVIDIVMVELRYSSGQIAVIKQAGGHLLESGMYGPDSVAITGAIDLPAGGHTMELWISAETYGNWWSENGFTFQVIEGQVLDAPGCVYTPPN